MSSRRDPRRLYMMPAHFGPAAGPRQAAAGGRHDLTRPGLVERFTFGFLTDPDALRALTPEPLEPVGPPEVWIDFGVLTRVPWLAGRGYNTLGVRFRARFRGNVDDVEGPFLAVLWENRPDPIITGREQLGYNKIYAELAEPRRCEDRVVLRASWDGFVFFEGEISGLGQPLPNESDAFRAGVGGDGILHHKYIPRTGEPWVDADADYFTLTAPAPNPAERGLVPPRLEAGSGIFAWRRPCWEDMPTQFRIVNALADLPVAGMIGAFRLQTHELKDYRDQRVLG